MTALLTRPTSSTSSARRSPAIDAFRGAAILLMVCDHLLMLALVLGAPHELQAIRLTVTRFAMPAFLGLSGWLLVTRGLPSSRRSLQVLAGGIIVAAGNLVGPFANPDILLIAALLVPAYGLVRRYPLAVLGVSMVATVNVPLSNYVHSWQGYDPALLLAWLAFGALVARTVTVEELPEFPAPLAAIGRRPLLVYVGHFLALDALWLVLRG